MSKRGGGDYKGKKRKTTTSKTKRPSNQILEVRVGFYLSLFSFSQSSQPPTNSNQLNKLKKKKQLSNGRRHIRDQIVHLTPTRARAHAHAQPRQLVMASFMSQPRERRRLVVPRRCVSLRGRVRPGPVSVRRRRRGERPRTLEAREVRRRPRGCVGFHRVESPALPLPLPLLLHLHGQR